MQVVVPSVSLALTPQGTALAGFVEMPSGPTLFKPGLELTSGKVPVDVGANGPSGLAGAVCVADEGSEIAGGPASGGG